MNTIDPVDQRMRAVGVIASALNGTKDEIARSYMIAAMDMLIASISDHVKPHKAFMIFGTVGEA